MEQVFEIGDKVRLRDGDGRVHVISEIPVTRTACGWFAIVRFEDNSAVGMVDSSGFTDMIKVEE